MFPEAFLLPKSPKVYQENGKRPDGMSLYSFKQGKILLWHFTCSDTLAPSHVEKSAKEPGKVANEAENRKNQQYEEIANSYHFVPVIAETLGVRRETGLSFMEDVGKPL